MTDATATLVLVSLNGEAHKYIAHAVDDRSTEFGQVACTEDDRFDALRFNDLESRVFDHLVEAVRWMKEGPE